jgi:hypothetical protein
MSKIGKILIRTYYTYINNCSCTIMFIRLRTVHLSTATKMARSGRILRSLFCYPLENCPYDKVIIETYPSYQNRLKSIVYTVLNKQPFRPTSNEDLWMLAWHGCTTCKGKMPVKSEYNIDAYTKWFETLKLKSLDHISATGSTLVDGMAVTLDDAVLTKSLHDAVESGDITKTMEFSPVDEHDEVVISETFQFGKFHSFFYERVIYGWEMGRRIIPTTNEVALTLSFMGRDKVPSRKEVVYMLEQRALADTIMEVD